MAYNAQLQVSEQDLRTVQPALQPSGLAYAPGIKLGAVGATADGRQYVYSLNNTSTAAVAGNIQTAPTVVANHITRTLPASPATVTAGSLTVAVTVGATAVTQSQYAQGYLVITTAAAPGGVLYKIKDNTAAVSSGTTTVTLAEPILTALVGGTTVVSLYPHPTNGFAISSSTVANNNLIGVPNIAVPTNNWAWLQTNGYCATLIDNTTVTKNIGLIGGASAGSVGIDLAAAVTQVVGYAPEALTSSVVQPIVLQIQ